MGDAPAGGRRAAVPWIAATLLYFGFTLLQTWPLVRHLSEVMASDLGDPVLNTWILWWNAHAVPFTAKWWNAPAFWPSTGALAFSEVLLGLTPITSPIQWLGGSPVAAYNVALFLTFPLSALAAHALAYRLTRRHDAALIAGLVYGFNPFRIAHLPQIQVLASYWMPLALLGLHEYLDRRDRRWLVLFGVAWLMQALSNGYYLLFFPVLAGAWIAWFALSRRMMGELRAIIVAWVIASLPLIPMLWTYRRVHAAFGFQRFVGEVNAFGADVTSLLDASSLLKFWKLTAFHQAEGELFPGFTASLLVLLLLGHWFMRSQRAARVPRRIALGLLAVGIVFVSVAVSAVVFGPWSIAIGNLTLLTVKVVSKPFGAGLLLMFGALAAITKPVAPWRARSPVMFYVLALGLMYLLCFGPRPHILGDPFMFRGPYSLLMLLPGYDAVRVPARFAMLAALCLSVVAAYAFARLTADRSHRARMAFAVLAVCGVIVDSAISEIPLEPLPLRLFSVEKLPGNAAVVELPFGSVHDDVMAMYRGMFHNHPVVNGYSGFFPKGFEFLARHLAAHDPTMFDALTAFGPVLVVVDMGRDADGMWRRQLAARSGVTIMQEELGRQMFLLPATGAPPSDENRPDRLPIAFASASVNDDRLKLALDGREDTRWNSGPQGGDEVVTLDLGVTRFIDQLTMTTGPFISDYPRTLVIETSDDKLEWTTRWQGSAAPAAFAAAVRRPREMPLNFELPHAPARWLRIRQLGRDPVYYWSIYELSVFGG